MNGKLTSITTDNKHLTADEEAYNFDVIKSIKAHEGFSGMPYHDSLGKLTIGYGTLLPISKEEAEMIFFSRLKKIETELSSRLDFIESMPVNIRKVLLEMAYNLGVHGLLGFHRMLDAMKRGDWNEAAKEGLNSRWHKQVKSRAENLMNIVRNT